MPTKLILIGIITLQICLAETIFMPPAGKEIDQACDAAIQGKSRPEAIQTLVDVAEGKPTDLILARARRAGLAPFSEKTLFAAPASRAYALEAIGRTGLPEAIQYLSDLTPEKIGPDDSRTIYPAAKLALLNALLRRETDPERQIVMLEHQLYTPVVPEAVLWAIHELCDRGSSRSLPRIEQVINGLYSGKRADDMVAFFRLQIEIVNRDPDRAKALGTVLRADAKRDQIKIMRWAVNQLLALQTTEARHVLERYATEVDQSYPDIAPGNSTLESDMHRGFAQMILQHSSGHRIE